MGRLTVYFLIGLFALDICSATAFASEAHEPRWGDFAWRVVNLILFCGILWYFIRNIWKNFFRNRRETIENTLSELESRRADARAKLKEIEERIANLEAERQAILDESRVQAERLKKGIVEDARRQADQIVDQARKTAENEGRAMLDQVRSTMADEIVNAASKALRGQLTEEDHDKLITDALDRVTPQ
ncbi:MAG: ATP synthase F0 subunit B [Desulfovibrio sp.]|nr:ATP synthase F0 subunit B [Desulfovibrio sp.]